MRDQIAAARRAGIAAETVNSANTDDWDEIHDRIAAGAVDLLVVSPERLNSPAFRDGVLPRLTAEVGPARGRRGPLHLRLGPRLPPRLPPHPRRPRRARRRPRAGVHRHRQRPRGGRRGRPARHRPGGPAGRPRPRVAAPVGARARPRRAAGLAGCPPGRPAGVGHRLHADRGAGRERGGVAARRGPRGRGLLGLDRRCRPRAHRARAAGQRAAGGRRHLGAGHGLRQGRRRLRGPPGRPALTHRLLPTGRPGGARRRPMPRSCCCRRRRTGRSGRGSTPPRSRPRAWCGGCSTSSRPTAAPCRPPRSSTGSTCGRGRLEAMLKVLDVDGAVERVAGGWRATGQPWVYDTQRYRRASPRRGGPSSRRCSTTWPSPAAACGSCAPSSTTRSSTATAAAATAAPARRPSRCPRT